ncbi:hypothetical protein [Pyruvatibacter mobilis]|uniref:hypothetical protein n=1 Tax=Pyruvatibacter mobilis TaxID=1712261 RepID=UPI003BA8418F
MSRFSVRRFLRQEKALLIHFDTVMNNHGTCYPDSLTNALVAKKSRLAFSTILATDQGPPPPYGAPPSPESPNDSEITHAAGWVGIVVDIDDRCSVTAVSAADAGSFILDGARESSGAPPTEENCRASIQDRTSYNEWTVQNFSPVGIFIFRPAFVRKPAPIEGIENVPAYLMQGTQEQLIIDQIIEPGEVARDFQAHRIFSSRQGQFEEFDRKTSQWNPVSYDDIITA